VEVEHPLDLKIILYLVINDYIGYFFVRLVALEIHIDHKNAGNRRVAFPVIEVGFGHQYNMGRHSMSMVAASLAKVMGNEHSAYMVKFPKKQQIILYIYIHTDRYAKMQKKDTGTYFQ
jgi:hypothetical protein